MSDSIFEIEYHPGEEIILHFKSPKSWGLAEPTKSHLLAAKKEMLLALRSLLDRTIERVEKADEEKEPKRARIKVE